MTEPYVVIDCCEDSHLRTIAAAVVDMPLVTGGSGIARYLPDVYRDRQLLAPTDHVPDLPQAKGRDHLHR